MELRVLHAAAKKVTWYGQWGYNYGRGAFNITHNKYATVQVYAYTLLNTSHPAIRALSNQHIRSWSFLWAEAKVKHNDASPVIISNNGFALYIMSSRRRG